MSTEQAATIAAAVQSVRGNQPGQVFRDMGDILSVPQLAVASPYLNTSSQAQITNGITDEAYEAIPSQLLPLLRGDSFGAVVLANGQTVVQFTGVEGQAYAIQVSPDLVNWTTISTNWAAGGVINFTNGASFSGPAEFYRSILLN